MNKKKTITIIDDNNHDAMLLKEEFERRGYKVVVIDPSRKLLENLKSKSSNIIVIDMFMGVLNAFDVLKFIDKSKKVFVLSGIDDGYLNFIEYGLKDRNIPLLSKDNFKQSADMICQAI